MDLGIALTDVAAASPRASKQPRRWNLRTGAEAEERVATCGLAPCNYAGLSWAGIVPADTNALVELNGRLGAAGSGLGLLSLFGDSTRRSVAARRPGVAACSSCCQECCYCALCASSWSQRKPPTAGSSGGAAGARAGARKRYSRAEPEQTAEPMNGSAEQ